MRPEQKRALASRLDATRTFLQDLVEENFSDDDLGYVVTCLDDAARALDLAIRRLRNESTRVM